MFTMTRIRKKHTCFSLKFLCSMYSLIFSTASSTTGPCPGQIRCGDKFKITSNDFMYVKRSSNTCRMVPQVIIKAMFTVLHITKQILSLCNLPMGLFRYIYIQIRCKAQRTQNKQNEMTMFIHYFFVFALQASLSSYLRQ